MFSFIEVFVLTIVITLIAFMLFVELPARLRAERARRRSERIEIHRDYLQRRTELIKERDIMDTLYFNIKYLEFIKRSNYGIHLKGGLIMKQYKIKMTNNHIFYVSSNDFFRIKNAIDHNAKFVEITDYFRNSDIPYKIFIINLSCILYMCED